MEVLREEEVLRLEEALLKRLEDRLGPSLHQTALDVAKTVMHELRLELMSYISRHEEMLRRLGRTEAALSEVPKAR